MSLTVEKIFVGTQHLKKIVEDLEKVKGALESIGTDKVRVSVVDALPESPFNLTKISGTALTGRNWSDDFAKLQNLDVALSSRASESTLNAIKSQTDKLTFDADNYLYVNVGKVVNPPNLDITLSSHRDSIVSAIQGRQPRELVLDDGTGSYGKVYRSGNALLISINEDKVGLAKESTLSSQLPRRLYGYDYDNAVWRALRVTSDGKVVGYLG